MKLTAWTGYAACAWSLLFAAPHVWWALGVPAAFPGGASTYGVAFRVSWFLAYDLVVVVLLVASALVALALVRDWGRFFFRRMLLAAAWVACAILTFRGLAGLVVDGPNDLIWWPTFLVGGMLFGATAWSHTKRSRDLPSRHGYAR